MEAQEALGDAAAEAAKEAQAVLEHPTEAAEATAPMDEMVLMARQDAAEVST